MLKVVRTCQCTLHKFWLPLTKGTVKTTTLLKTILAASYLPKKTASFELKKTQTPSELSAAFRLQGEANIRDTSYILIRHG
jgi:hypothetical protein